MKNLRGPTLSQSLGAGWHLALAALVVLGVACGKPLGFDNRLCPCLMDAGFFCCEKICLRVGERCPSQTGSVR